MTRIAIFFAAGLACWTMSAHADGLSARVTDPGYGALCDGSASTRPMPCQNTTDDTCGFINALNAVCAAGGGELIIPPGTCIVNTFGMNLPVCSNLTIRGTGPKSIVKVRANSGAYHEIFGLPTNPGPIANVVFKDFLVDQNPSGNQVTPPAETLHVINFNASTVNGITISGMVFNPTAGLHAIHLETNGDLRATVVNNYFNFAKPPSSPIYDNSGIYLEGSQQVVSGNTFVSTLSQGAGTAIESHGGRSTIANNTTNNYASLVNVVPTATGYSELSPNNITVGNNSVTCAQNAVVLTGVASRTLRNVAITGNTLHVCNSTRFPTASVHNFAGVRWNGTSGDVDGLVVSNNVVAMQAQPLDTGYSSYGPTNGGILLYTGGNLSNVLVTGNIVTNSPVSGIRVGSSSTATGFPVQRVSVTGNVIVDAGNNSQLGSTTTDSPYRHAIGLWGTAKEVDVMRNMIYDTGNGATTPVSNGLYGLYLNPTQTPLSANIRTSQNTVRGASSATPVLLAFQTANAGIVDATNANDVSISTVTANSATSTAVPNVDFMSFTRYITTIRSLAGSSSPLLVNVPLPGGDPTATQWSVGQQVTFRFRCDNTGAGGCFVTFDAAFSGACETQTGQACPAGPTTMFIDTSPAGSPVQRGRAITFGVESVATSGLRFFELYRTPTPGVPD